MDFSYTSELKWNNDVYFSGKYKAPDTCPHCKRKNIINPERITVYPINSNDSAIIISTKCANCDKHYIVIYQRNFEKTRLDFLHLVPVLNEDGDYQDLYAFSPMFAEIHKQAVQAYQMGMNRLAGCGFRTAAELLLKDYAVHKMSIPIDEVASKPLGSILKNYYSELTEGDAANIVRVLGNDSVHYIQKHTDVETGTMFQFYMYLVSIVNMKLACKDMQIKYE